MNILLTNTNLIKINSLINIESFCEPQLIYLTMLELVEEVPIENINLTNIITSLQDKGRLKKIGGIERIISTISNFENFSDLESYIHLINEKYLRRLIIEFGKQVIILGYTTSLNLNNILEEMEKTLFLLNQQNKGQKLYSIAEIVNEVFIEMKTKIKENKDTGLLTCFKDLDSILQGVQKFRFDHCCRATINGKNCLFFNYGKKYC